MDHPQLQTVLLNFPDLDASSLPWPAGAESWEVKDLELFIGSGGFLKPKKKKQQTLESKPASGQGSNTSGAATDRPAGYAPEATAPAAAEAAAPAAAAAPASSEAEEQESSFEVPGFSRERRAITMPVRVHCEDTSPIGHVRLESLTAFAERIRSLALKQIMNVSLADLREKNLAILATEYVCEIVGTGMRVLETLRIDTTPEFPSAPLFPWKTRMYSSDGQLYMKGLFGLNLCQISDSGAYSGVDETTYREFTKDIRKYANPGQSSFSATNLRFFNCYGRSGSAFTPTARAEVRYVVRAADCDMYNVLFQARVPSMMEACHPRRDAMAFYVNIRRSVRPGDELQVHVFSNEDAALFVCLLGKDAVLAAFGQYGKVVPMCQEPLKCASIRLPSILKFCTGGAKPDACEDFDFGKV
eukprot:TRINITY_DN20685_c0_g1_i1.p1 TRINITY_DN20685_c0_g1~~TRINITY_DN20685_c0_g1_i1.p1  ORF type:complete len:424 (+),score=80.44 TRINITY_DN20685_c0_g1_i1:30-1274(+)